MPPNISTPPLLTTWKEKKKKKKSHHRPAATRLHITIHTATPPQHQPPTRSNNPKWKQKFQNQRSMKPTLIQPPSKPTNHHNYSNCSGHQPQNQTWKHQTQPTKTHHQWPSPLKPITNNPPHHREGHRHSNLAMTHPTTDLITDRHHKRGRVHRWVAPPMGSTGQWVALVSGWPRCWVVLVSGWRHQVLGENV